MGKKISQKRGHHKYDYLGRLYGPFVVEQDLGTILDSFSLKILTMTAKQADQISLQYLKTPLVNILWSGSSYSCVGLE